MQQLCHAPLRYGIPCDFLSLYDYLFAFLYRRKHSNIHSELCIHTHTHTHVHTDTCTHTHAHTHVHSHKTVAAYHVKDFRKTTRKLAE